MAFLLTIDGHMVQTEHAFHEAVMNASGIGWYGHNLDALWDLLTGLVESPISIRWRAATVSQAAMGDGFDKIVEVIRAAEGHYQSERPEEEFTFELSDQ
jgi:ribonuclease inhibitor